MYSDKNALPFFNSDNCHGDNFYYPNEDRMRQAIKFWLRVPKNELEQNLCKGLLNSRGTKLDIKINHLPMCANVDTCSFAILKGSSLFSDFSITVENNLILREDSI